MLPTSAAARPSHSRLTQPIVSSIFQDFQRESLVHLHARRAEQRSHRLRRAPLPSDHFAEVILMYTQFQNRGLRSFDGLHLHIVRMVDKSLGDRFDQFLHKASLHFHDEYGCAPARKNRISRTQSSPSAFPNGKDALGQQEDARRRKKLRTPVRPGSQAGVLRQPSYAIFCNLMKLRTVSLGCAPTPSQCLMRSASSFNSAGFFSGSYVPTNSTTRPFRGRVFSITTTR